MKDNSESKICIRGIWTYTYSNYITSVSLQPCIGLHAYTYVIATRKQFIIIQNDYRSLVNKMKGESRLVDFLKINHVPFVKTYTGNT